MKRLALLVFIAALTIGLCVAYATGTVSSSGSWLKFSFGKGIRGSGNVVTETRNVPKFTGVDFGGAMNVDIIAQRSQNVEIETDDNLVPLITTEVHGETLYITNTQKINWNSRVKVRINVEDLESLNVSGASKASATAIKSENFKIGVSGASKVTLDGEATSLNADSSGASKIDAENFRVVNAKADASGASKITVFASDSIDANASGASKVSYAGNPKTVNKKASGASKVSAQ